MAHYTLHQMDTARSTRIWPLGSIFSLVCTIGLGSLSVSTNAQEQPQPGLVLKTSDTSAKGKSDWTTRPNARPDQGAGQPPAKQPSKQQAVSSYQSGKGGANVTRPVVIVNGTPITNEEIDMRANLMSLGPQLSERAQREFKALVSSKRTAERWQATQRRIIQENQFTSTVDQIKSKLGAAMRQMQQEISQQAFQSARSGFARTLRGRAKENLIDEQIKLNAPRELGMKLNMDSIDGAVDRVMADRAKSAKKTPKEFAAHLRKLGTDESMMKQSVRAEFIWREVVRSRFRPFISPNLKEVEELITSAPTNEGGDDQTLKLHRLSLKQAPSASDAQKVRAQLTAEQLMKSYKGCGESAKLAASRKDVAFEDLGARRLSEIPEPARSLLRHAKVGDILPPQPANDGLHLYALCERVSGNAITDDNRRKAEAEIISDHLDRRARGLLLDLRRRARIEER